MYRCDSDDEAPTVMAPAATRTPATAPMLAVPRASHVPRDIADYANAFAQAEELAQAAAHVHASRYATPPPPAPASRTLPIPIPRTSSRAAHPAGPRSQAELDARRRHAQTFQIRGRKPATPWASIALVTFVGVVACLSAMAAAIQFKDSPRSSAPRRTAPAAVLPVQAPAPAAATVTIPTS